jgi:hypothetical protein
MPRYRISMYSTYRDEYDVEAASAEEALARADAAVFEGDRPPPHAGVRFTGAVARDAGAVARDAGQGVHHVRHEKVAQYRAQSHRCVED